MVWGNEQTDDKQIPHLQGYCEFNRSERLAFLRRIFDTAHWERAIELLQPITYTVQSPEILIA